MNLELFYWLGPLIVLLLGSRLSQGRARDILFNLFLGLLTIFVVISTYPTSSKGQKTEQRMAILDLNKVEMQLRIESAIETSDQLWEKIIGKKRNRGVFGGAWSQPDKAKSYGHAASIKYLEGALEKHKNSPEIKLRLALALWSDSQSNVLRIVKILREIDPASKLGPLAQSLEQIALGKKPDEKQLHQAMTIARSSLPKGWFQEEALLWLYSSDKNSQAYKNLKVQIADNSVGLLFRVASLMLGALFVGFVGVIVLVIELFKLSRKSVKQVIEPKPWSAKLTYTIFVSWMASQIIVGKIAQALIQPISLETTGPWAAITMTGLLYFLSNLPGMLLIYFLALKPYKLTFASGLGLRLSSPGYSTIKLCLIGILAWCTLFPIVLSSALLIKNPGSSNPMMTIAMEIGRNSEVWSAAFLIIVVSLMAPLCEEILFRGFLFQAFERWFSTRASIFLSSVAFAAVHLDPNVFLQLFCLGYVFALVFQRTRSLLPSMVAHGLWNSCVFIVSWSVLST